MLILSLFFHYSGYDFRSFSAVGFIMRSIHFFAKLLMYVMRRCRAVFPWLRIYWETRNQWVMYA